MLIENKREVGKTYRVNYGRLRFEYEKWIIVEKYIIYVKIGRCLIVIIIFRLLKLNQQRHFG